MQRIAAVFQALFRVYRDSGFVMASAVAFSFILSIFPFCILMGSLAGLIGGRELADQAVAIMVDILPEKVAAPLAPQVEAVMGSSRYDLLTVGGGFALFFATGAIETMRQALNTAYRVPETRYYPTCLAISTAFVVVGAVLLLILTAGLVVWPAIVARLEPQWLAQPEADWVRVLLSSAWLSAGVRYAIAGCAIGLQLTAMHLWLAAGRRSLQDVWPGVLLSVLLWLMTAGLFSIYLDINDYSRFYAGLSQVMASLIFFWVTAVIVLIGAELNRGLIELRKL